MIPHPLLYEWNRSWPHSLRREAGTENERGGRHKTAKSPFGADVRELVTMLEYARHRSEHEAEEVERYQQTLREILWRLELSPDPPPLYTLPDWPGELDFAGVRLLKARERVRRR